KAAKEKSDRGSKRKVESDIAPTSDPKEAVCFYCNTKGRWKRSCPKYLKDLKDGLKESRRLKHGELNLVMGNMKIMLVTRIGKYELMLKSGVRIDLNNCCYSSEMTRNIISFHALFKDGYKFSFDNENGDILVYSNGCFMFKASPYKRIYETVECISHNGNDGVLESFDFKSDDVCESCLLGKMTKSPFTGSYERGEGLLDLVHTDVYGPFRSATKDGKRYYVTFTDDFSIYGYVYLIKHKSDTFEVFKRYQNKVENQLGRKIKVLQSDRGGEYLSIEFFDHLKNCGIVSQLTPPRTPKLNRIAERRNKTLLDMVRSMMSRATLPISFWGYALETATHILNLVPTKKVSKTPFEMWKGKRPSLGHIKIWGCEVYVRQEAHDKLEAIFEKCLFVGYPEESFGYLFYKPKDNVICVVTPVKPDDISLPIRKTSGRVNKPLQFYYGFHIEEDKISDSTLSGLDEHANYKEAMASPEAAKWKEAMKSEIQSMYDNQVWNLVDTTPGLKTMDVKNAFLNGKLTKDVFMAQPECFENAKYPKRVCKLQKAIYGLKQDSHSWNLCFYEKVTQFGFSRSEDESCIYVKVSGSVVVFLVLYVDDILLIGNDIPTLQSVKDWLGKCFAMKDLGDAAYILGIKIYRDRSKRIIGLSQDTNLDKILKRLKMENSKKGNLPLHHGIKIRSIMYAMTCTRPDVSFALIMVSRHQQNPGEGYWIDVKNILKYLRNTKDRFLVYGGEKELRVTGYYDASWQTNKYYSHSQSGWVLLLNGGADSKEAIWMNFIGDLGVVPTVQDPIEIFCDNERVVALTKEPTDHRKSKHIERKYHFVQSKVEEGHVIMKHIRLEDNPADPFTKALAKSIHDEHARSI
ncbi:retrotransposon protein, putative, ty1-copia subclass, partial [Tanacetum coccineum]